MKRLFAIFCITFLSGCAAGLYTKGDAYAGPIEIMSNKATIYLYRPEAFVGSAREYNMLINGEVSAVLPNGTYSTLYLDPGKHSFGAQILENVYGDGPYIEISYKVEAGKEYFIGYFKVMPLSSKKNGDYFIHKVRSKVYNPVVEGGLLDADHQIGLVKKDYAISELKKLNKSVKKTL